jgi:hypothetical protein
VRTERLIDPNDYNVPGSPARSNCADIAANPHRDALLREHVQALFNTKHWRSRVALTFTLKQAVEIDKTWVKLTHDICTREFQRFMKRLNRSVYANVNRYGGKRLLVLDVIEKDKHGRWHIHAAIEPPEKMTDFQFGQTIKKCWLGWNEKTKNIWAYRETDIKFGANEGWIEYMLKAAQKSGLDSWSDCIDWYSLYNPNANTHIAVHSAEHKSQSH